MATVCKWTWESIDFNSFSSSFIPDNANEYLTAFIPATVAAAAIITIPIKAAAVITMATYSTDRNPHFTTSLRPGHTPASSGGCLTWPAAQHPPAASALELVSTRSFSYQPFPPRSPGVHSPSCVSFLRSFLFFEVRVCICFPFPIFHSFCSNYSGAIWLCSLSVINLHKTFYTIMLKDVAENIE